MADGSKKSIEDVKEGDFLLAFNHESGSLESSEVVLAYKGDSKAEVLRLFFDTTSLDIVGTHDLLEQSTMKYVKINKSNVADYVGHKFYNATTASWEVLGSYQSIGQSDYYCLYTAYTINCIANDMLTCPDDNDAVLNVYELDSTLKADLVQLGVDLETYGVFNDTTYASAEPFLVKYAYVAIAKGYATYEELISIFNSWF